MAARDLETIQKGLRQENSTMVSIVQQCLDRISATTHLNIYVEVYGEESLQQAAALDEKLKKGEKVGLLFGLVVSVKDVISQKGKGLTAASKILEGYTSPYDATAIKRLLAEDAIIIGRTNCDEFGMGSANENSIYGPTLNGIGENRIPGGSSGAAAVSVEQQTCHIALGSDTGGSVRQPASFCGILGFKPSYGVVSRYGLIAYASSFDQIGILGHDAKSIEQVLDVISGKDDMDATSHSKELDTSEKDKKKIAYIPEMINHSKLRPQVKDAINAEMERLVADGYTMEAVDFSFLEYLVPCYYVLTTAEASTNLSRYDGVRYGHRSTISNNLEEMYVNTRTEGFGKEVKRRIMLGTYVLSEGYFDAYYGQAQKVRRLVTEQMNSILEQYDFLFLPTSTRTAWQVGELADDPIEVYLSDMYTVLANLTGLPAVSIPCGVDDDNMPIGYQIMTRKYGDRDLLAFAKTQ